MKTKPESLTNEETCRRNTELDVFLVNEASIFFYKLNQCLCCLDSLGEETITIKSGINQHPMAISTYLNLPFYSSFTFHPLQA